MANMYKFNYGRKVKAAQYMNMKISLPADHKGRPDWKFMDRFMRSLHHKAIKTSVRKKTFLNSICLNGKNIRWMLYFTLKKANA